MKEDNSLSETVIYSFFGAGIGALISTEINYFLSVYQKIGENLKELALPVECPIEYPLELIATYPIFTGVILGGLSGIIIGTSNNKKMK